MRCPDCNRFVAFDYEQEPEVDLSPMFTGLQEVTTEITVRHLLTCAECGTELKEANEEDSFSFDYTETKEFLALSPEEQQQMCSAPNLLVKAEVENPSATELGTKVSINVPMVFTFTDDRTMEELLVISQEREVVIPKSSYEECC